MGAGISHCAGGIAAAMAELEGATPTIHRRSSGSSADSYLLVRCNAWFCGGSVPTRLGKSAAHGVDSVFQNGAPWPMKMGTTVSLWRCDTAASYALALPKTRSPTI